MHPVYNQFSRSFRHIYYAISTVYLAVVEYIFEQLWKDGVQVFLSHQPR
jgi:hypothetical protein